MPDNLGSWPAWYLAVVVAYAAFLGAIAVYDARTHRIPNRAVYPALVAAVALAFVHPRGPWWSFLLAGLFAGSLFVLLGIATRGGIGFGDAKLAALIGLMSGWPVVLVALFLAFSSGAVVGVALIASGRIARRDPVPFGPALATGAVAAVVAGPQLVGLLWPAFASS